MIDVIVERINDDFDRSWSVANQSNDWICLFTTAFKIKINMNRYRDNVLTLSLYALHINGPKTDLKHQCNRKVTWMLSFYINITDNFTRPKHRFLLDKFHRVS